MRFIGSVLLASLVACSESLAPSDFYGVWNDEGARLTLTETQARFETSCWAGDVAIPIQVSGNTFFALGTVNSQGGAGGTQMSTVTLRGELDGDELTLRVEPQSLGLGPYTMLRNNPIAIPGCP